MARPRQDENALLLTLRRVLLALLVLSLLGLFALWRVDNPRVERMRSAVTDRFVPSFSWALAPLTALSRIAGDFQSYTRIYEQNRELRREVQQLKAWREAAIQLEQQNARLLELNNVRLDPKLTFVTGVVMADSGSPFRRSVLINIGRSDGIVDGWATMDGLGLVGRISGVGQRTARVVLLNDTNSRVPVIVQPSGQRALLVGDNTGAPLLDLLESPEDIRPGDRVVTSGDGGLLPAGLLVGSAALGSDRRLRVRLAADYQRLEFLRVLRSVPAERLDDPGALLLPRALVPEGLSPRAEAGE